ncbi:MAG: hypothetical protein WC553_03420 [Patescibacteria group bacterium]
MVGFSVSDHKPEWGITPFLKFDTGNTTKPARIIVLLYLISGEGKMGRNVISQLDGLHQYGEALRRLVRECGRTKAEAIQMLWYDRDALLSAGVTSMQLLELETAIDIEEQEGRLKPQQCQFGSSE